MVQLLCCVAVNNDDYGLWVKRVVKVMMYTGDKIYLVVKTTNEPQSSGTQLYL